MNANPWMEDLVFHKQLSGFHIFNHTFRIDWLGVLKSRICLFLKEFAKSGMLSRYFEFPCINFLQWRNQQKYTTFPY